MGRLISLVLLLLFIFSCSSIPVIDRSKLYSKPFLNRIEAIKAVYRNGQQARALNMLKYMKNETLKVSERAFRDNLMGVITFSIGNYKVALTHFDRALSLATMDPYLRTQIRLNIASSHYKLGALEKAYGTLEHIRIELLEKRDHKKYYLLTYNIAKELNKGEGVVRSLVGLLEEKKSLVELKAEPMFGVLLTNYFKMDASERNKLLFKLDRTSSIAAGYLAYLDAEKRYYAGERDEAAYMLRSIGRRYYRSAEINDLIKNFFSRIENFSKMNITSIGVVLPLSGKKRVFGRRALFGIDKAVREFALDKYKIHVVDSKGSGTVGAHKVRELLEQNHVSAIIGGLFSDEATREYQEAKGNGVLFISLSPIYLSKSHKNHMLIEVPGSIESQVKRLFSSDLISTFGSRGAIIYPDSGRGNAYVEEFWRNAQNSNVDVTGMQSYREDEMDYREPVKRLLGLKFISERQEEFDIISEIHRLEKNKSVRRIQVLKPQVDFDWVFVPALPREALQIIPSFAYFDAFNIKLIGGPSWRSRALANRKSKFVSSYFIGDDLSNVGEDFSRSFYQSYKVKPRIIEMLGFDSFKLLSSLLSGFGGGARDELDRHIRSKGTLKGITGTWGLQDGSWIKETVPYRLRRGKIQRLSSFSE